MSFNKQTWIVIFLTIVGLYWCKCGWSDTKSQVQWLSYFILESISTI